MADEALRLIGSTHGGQQNMTMTSVEAEHNIYEELKYNRSESQVRLKRAALGTYS